MAELDVENIVREVMARLRLDAAAGAKRAADGKNEQKVELATGRLTLNESLVTLAAVTGRLAGIRQLVLRPKTVLTPAVKDLLRERSVEVVFQSLGGLGAEATFAANWKLALALAETKYDASVLTRNLRHEGLELEQISDKGMKAALDALADGVIRAARPGWLLTSEAPAAVCWANRKSGVRAAGAGSAAEVKSALRSAGANLLVTDPAGKSYWQLLQIARAFARGAGQECPAWLRD